MSEFSCSRHVNITCGTSRANVEHIVTFKTFLVWRIVILYWSAFLWRRFIDHVALRGAFAKFQSWVPGEAFFCITNALVGDAVQFVTKLGANFTSLGVAAAITASLSQRAAVAVSFI